MHQAARQTPSDTWRRNKPGIRRFATWLLGGQVDQLGWTGRRATVPAKALHPNRRMEAADETAVGSLPACRCRGGSPKSVFHSSAPGADDGKVGRVRNHGAGRCRHLFRRATGFATHGHSGTACSTGRIGQAGLRGQIRHGGARRPGRHVARPESRPPPALWHGRLSFLRAAVSGRFMECPVTSELRRRNLYRHESERANRS